MKKLTIVLFLSVFQLTWINAQKIFSLNEAIQYAELYSNTLKIQKLDVQDAQNLITEYRAIGMPKLNGGISYNYFIDIPTSILPDFISPSVYEVLFKENLLNRRDINYGSGIPAQFGTKNNLTGKLELQSLLFDGSFIVGLKAQALYKDLIIRQINQSSVEVKYQVAKAYMAALAIKTNLNILDKNIENLNKLYKDVSQVYKAGLTEKLDVERLELSLQNLGVEKEKLVRLFDITKNILKYQMSYPLEQDIELSQNFEELTNSSYLEVMDPSITLNIQNRAEYAVIDQGRRLAEINIKRFKYSYYPTLYGFANAQRSLQRNNLFDSKENKWFPTTLVGVNLNVPIFDGFDRKSKVNKAKILLERTNMQMTEFERGAKLGFENAKIQYLNAMNTYDSRKKTLTLAEKIYNASQIKFKEGVGSSLEVINAERDVYTAQANVLDAQTSLINSKIDLDKALGKI